MVNNVFETEIDQTYALPGEIYSNEKVILLMIVDIRLHDEKNLSTHSRYTAFHCTIAEKSSHP